MRYGTLKAGMHSLRFGLVRIAPIREHDVVLIKAGLLVFTKCSETIQDGRRLENVSWRLWYRQLNAAAHAAASITAGGKQIGDEAMAYVIADEKFAREDEEWDEKMGLLVEEATATVSDTTNTIQGIPAPESSPEQERKTEQEQQVPRYPAQLDTCTEEAQSLVLLPHDQG
jgi:Fungal protein of unknown function (DUF1752)